MLLVVCYVFVQQREQVVVQSCRHVVMVVSVFTMATVGQLITIMDACVKLAIQEDHVKKVCVCVCVCVCVRVCVCVCVCLCVCEQLFMSLCDSLHQCLVFS